MIVVKWEFDGDEQDLPMVQTTVERILGRYQRAIGGIHCPVHGAGPSLRVRGQTAADLELTIEPCCQAFIDETNVRIHRRRRDSARQRPTRLVPRSERRRVSRLA
jgi:hypothetical protein